MTGFAKIYQQAHCLNKPNIINRMALEQVHRILVEEREILLRVSLPSGVMGGGHCDELDELDDEEHAADENEKDEKHSADEVGTSGAGWLL